MPRRIITWTGSRWYFPETMERESCTETTRPGKSPGIDHFVRIDFPCVELANAGTTAEA
jgi:hypothetical protein